MSEPDRLFLDANILFSMAYGSKGLATFWGLAAEGKCVLLSSEYAVEEARWNLSNGDQVRIQELLAPLIIVPQPAMALPDDHGLPEKDAPILAAAVSARATHLITGDLRHFGHLRGKTIHGVRVCLPCDYLLAHTP